MASMKSNAAKKARNDVCNLPVSGFIRLDKVLAILGIGRTTFLNGVKNGTLPKPYKFSPKISLWSVDEIESVVERIKSESPHRGKRTGGPKIKHGSKSVKVRKNVDEQAESESGPILLDFCEAAELCSMGLSTFGKLVHAESIPKPLQIGPTYRWRKSDLTEWVAAGCQKNWKNKNGTD